MRATTWELCLIIDNDQNFLRQWLIAARLNDWSPESAEDHAESAVQTTSFTHGASFVRCVARQFFSQVDWQEVYEHYKRKVEEGATVPEVTP